MPKSEPKNAITTAPEEGNVVTLLSALMSGGMCERLPKRPLTTDPMVTTDATGGLVRNNELVLHARLLLEIQNEASKEVENNRKRGVELKMPKSRPLIATHAPPVQLHDAAVMFTTVA